MSDIQVAYLCDGKGCEKGCSCDSACYRTLDIWHAKNFVYLGNGKFVERDIDMDEQNTVEQATETVAEEPKKIFKNLDKDSKRFYNLLHTLFNVCTLAGFKIEGRIKIRDLKTGKVWE